MGGKAWLEGRKGEERAGVPPKNFGGRATSRPERRFASQGQIKPACRQAGAPGNHALTGPIKN